MVHYTVTQENLSELCEAWLEARDQECEAAQRRLKLEQQIKALINIPRDLEGTHVTVVGPYTIKAVSRVRREVDTDIVFKIAREQGLTKYLPELFRWYAEIHQENWRRADEHITGYFEPALSLKFSRPDFFIVKAQETQEASTAQ